MLIPAATLGVIVFIYGLATILDDIPRLDCMSIKAVHEKNIFNANAKSSEFKPFFKRKLNIQDWKKL